MRAHLILVLVPIAFGCSEEPPPVEIQTAPRVSPQAATPVVAKAPGANLVVDQNGTHIAAGGARVEADPRGARVAAGNAEVRADENGVVVGAGNTQIRVDESGVTIPGLGRIAAPQAMQGTMTTISSSRIQCSGTDRVVRNNVVLDGGDGPAILASGSCRVTCNNCTIRSSAAAILASGSSRITLNGGTVTGRVAIAGSGSTRVTTNATQIRGTVNRSGNAQVQQN